MNAASLTPPPPHPHSIGGFFVWVPNHVFVYRAWNYLFIIVVATLCIVVDVIVKIFAFWYFPSQTQIYAEMSKIDGNIQHGEEGEKTNFCCGFDTISFCRRGGEERKEERGAKIARGKKCEERSDEY